MSGAESSGKGHVVDAAMFNGTASILMAMFFSTAAGRGLIPSVA